MRLAVGRVIVRQFVRVLAPGQRRPDELPVETCAWLFRRQQGAWAAAPLRHYFVRALANLHGEGSLHRFRRYVRQVGDWFAESWPQQQHVATVNM